MKHAIKQKLCVLLAAVTGATLCACSTEQAESSFDNPLPWSDGEASYEKLDYSVAIYDTTSSTAEDKRVKIADGSLAYTLTASGEFTTIAMEFSVTYAADAPAPDAGLTDTITSTVKFRTNSLNTQTMEKTVTLADRDGTENLSYKLTADYVDTYKATLLYTAKEGATEKTRSLPRDTCHDNEMMFYIARAQGISTGSSTMFKMVNVFDSFVTGETALYTMAVSGGESKQKLDIGDWVKDFGIEAVTDEKTNTTTYPVSCFYTSIGINADRHGPPYVVMYSEKPFVSGGKEHKKLPVRIEYSQYRSNKAYRHTEYTLTSCSFDRQTSGN